MDWMAGTAVSDGDSAHQDGTERIARAGGWLGDGRDTDYGKEEGKTAEEKTTVGKRE